MCLSAVALATADLSRRSSKNEDGSSAPKVARLPDPLFFCV